MLGFGDRLAYPLCFMVLKYFDTDPTWLTKLVRCQSWLLKIIFYVPKFAPIYCYKDCHAGLNSIETEIALRKLLFLGRLITEPKMAQICQKLVYELGTG